MPSLGLRREPLAGCVCGDASLAPALYGLIGVIAVLPSLIPNVIAVAGKVDGVIDCFDALGGANLTQPGITCDGCHPVDKGYVVRAGHM